VLHEVLTIAQVIAIACIMSASIGSTFGVKRDSAKEVTADEIPADVL
jgi:threonine/homoserine efflux transporter RhtA